MMRCNFHYRLLLLAGLSFAVFLLTLSPAFSNYLHQDGYSEYGREQFSAATQEKIQSLFSGLEIVGNTYNASGSKAAGLAALESGCKFTVDQFLKTQLLQSLMPEIGADAGWSFAGAAWLDNKISGLSLRARSALCMMLKGEEIESVNWSDAFQSMIRDEALPMLMMQGVGMANRSNLPFLTRLEVEFGLSQGSFVNSLTTVQPLWKDEAGNHHIFTQLSYYKAPEEKNDQGYRIKHDTVNAGLAYRYLTEDEKYLYGANVFFDHAPKRDHNRMSVGVDARTSQLALSANRYIPLSGWRTLDLYYEDRVAAGWDLELRGQLPEFPSWTASVKGYQWDEQHNGKDLYGVKTALEYSPVPAMALRLGFDKDSQNSPSFEAVLRLNFKFDEPQEAQWKRRTELAPVSAHVYDKVQRENIIRTKVRRSAGSKLTVIETVGANISVSEDGTANLYVGQTLLMPVTVTTANAVGAVARLRFAKGAILTLGQDTQVEIVPDLITLISGTMQFVSDGVITNIVVPGGTISLHGTDIDVVSDGVNSSVRVRDGAVTLAGAVSGSATIGGGGMAGAVAGVVGIIPAGSASFLSHTNQVSEEIDRVASPITGSKVAPYPYQAPRIVSEDMSLGGQIIIGLKYNEPVVVSAGVPLMNIVINGHNRTATFVSGSGTDDLYFSYTIQGGDASAVNLTVSGLDENGSSISSGGKRAITTIASTVLALNGSGADTNSPAGYAVAFITDPVNDTNKAMVSFDITSAEVGSTYDYEISSSVGAGSVAGYGVVSAATETVSGIDVSGLPDGTLTITLTLTDENLNVGAAVTDTIVKDTVAPYVVSVAPPADAIYAP